MRLDAVFERLLHRLPIGDTHFSGDGRGAKRRQHFIEQFVGERIMRIVHNRPLAD
jgi:hypothetical protein